MTLSEFVSTGPGLLLFSLAVPAIFFLFFFALHHSRQAAMRARRINRVQQMPGLDGGSKTALSLKRITKDSGIGAIDSLIKHVVPNPENLRAKLDRTGYNISLGIYLMASALVGLLVVLIGRLYPVLPIAAVILFGVFAAIVLPHGFVAMLSKRRIKKFLEAFPEAIDLIVRGLKSGLPVTESIKTVSAELGGPVAVEFARISDNIKFGKSMPEALEACAKRLGIPEFRFFTISLGIQQETGGNLAETLGNLSDVLRRRRQMKLKIKAFSSEAKASAYIIGSLPFLMEGLILSVNYDYAIQLFTDDRGLVMVGFGLVSFMIGAGVMAKMVRFEI
ncbi:MAG TPA: type II secretion system F family protein [Alphaproteobacteria bacterium]|nr:type II secretion system F family protein [Alphaproteobacteria bacterium]